ncbi:MAG: SH3 domain-containing protein [Candidatus Methylomirabilales bacterium]
MQLLNLRRCPGMQCTLLAVLAQNDAVIRLRENGEWVEVRLVKTGQTGWVAGRFLVDRPVAATSKSGAPAAAPPAPVATAPTPAAPAAPSRPAQGGALKEEFLE